MDLRRILANGLGTALKTRSAYEPQLVANMVWEIPRSVNRWSSSAGSRMHVRSGGIFVHQQPKVECIDFPERRPASVEIGDLLLIRQEVKRGEVQKRASLLLQAKKYARTPVSPDNPNQHHLYARWPEFKYTKASHKDLYGEVRHIEGSDLYNGAKYLLIDKNHSYDPLDHNLWYPHGECGYGMTAHPTQPDFTHYRCFLSELTDFIVGDAGKPFDQPVTASMNWSRVMQDLIGVTAHQASTYFGSTHGQRKGPRGQLLFMCGEFTEEGLLSETAYSRGASPMGSARDFEGMFDGPPQVPTERRIDDWDGGMPIIEFTVYSDSVDEEWR